MRKALLGSAAWNHVPLPPPVLEKFEGSVIYSSAPKLQAKILKLGTGELILTSETAYVANPPKRRR